MQVTEVKLFKSKQEGVVKAYGKATLDNELVLDVIVMGNDKGTWATFPNGKKGADGKYYLPVFFKTKEKDEEFKQRILAEFAKISGSTPTARPQTPVENLPF